MMIEFKWFPIESGEMPNAAVPVKVNGVTRLCILMYRGVSDPPGSYSLALSEKTKGLMMVADSATWQKVEVDGFS